VPYRATGKPNGRPRTKPWTDALHHALQRADQLESEAAAHRAKAAGRLARELAGGKTRVQLATELGWTVNDIRRALRDASVPIRTGKQHSDKQDGDRRDQRGNR
jgi:hypothetical protein